MKMNFVLNLVIVGYHGYDTYSVAFPSNIVLVSILMITCPCNVHPLTPHFNIVELRFTGVYIIFLFLLQHIDCEYSLEPPH